jgi:hypothetical protein
MEVFYAARAQEDRTYWERENATSNSQFEIRLKSEGK